MTPEAETIARYETLRLRLSEILSLADKIDEELIALEAHLPSDYRHPDDLTSQHRSLLTINVGTMLDPDAHKSAKALRETETSNNPPLIIRC